MEWKQQNRTYQILKAAEEGGYGVLAAIAYNIESILGLIRAAEAKRSPLILQHKITTEAEPGRIEGGEDGIADTADLEGALTTPEQVEDFIATGIDFLAPAFGNVHGDYGPRGPVLEYDRLAKIRETIAGRVRLVVHGTNDWSEEVTKKCVVGGCVKVNVNKLVLLDYLNHLKVNAPSKSITVLMEEGTKEIQTLTEWAMDVCGSTGKA
ncbi:putative fructose-bisphosphate aldolase [Diaporthe ampelina]|uniref:Fructose-bisphosphate aldolase n=1 Tax=Diaporthe ampelina TaxID=1214573 RepID=A0A0G2HWI4_9PEZI|nr:putative fructose-bisphosphate aldolase [Diaporthe ampelina]